MNERLFGMPIVAIVAAAFAGAGVLHGVAAESPVQVAGQDFLAKATVALKAVQTKVKDDKILGPLTNAKVEEGKDYQTGNGYLTVFTKTPESWPNFPSKPHNLARGYGSLRLDVYAELPKELSWTPIMPPPGCYCGRTYLVVPETQAKIVIWTTTSDPEAQRRLVNMIVKELGNTGIVARPSDPEKVDSVPRPPTGFGPPNIPVPSSPPTQPRGCS